MEATLSRRERERLVRRQAMLEAARSVFAEKGYTNATLEEIAQRAEFGKGTLYNYFEGGKEEILFAIFDELYEELHAQMRQAFAPEVTAGRPFRAVFQDFLVTSFTFFLAQQDLFLILFKEAHRMAFSDNPSNASYFIQQRQRMVEALIPPLEDAIQRGELRTFSPYALALMVLGNLQGLQMHLLLEGKEACCTPSTYREQSIRSAADAAAFLTTILLDGLLVKPEPALTDKKP